MESNKKYRVGDFARIVGFITAALVLSVLTVPPALAVLRPDFVALALIYLARFHPHGIGVFTAFVAGLLVDVITFGTLGQHAIAKVVLVYLMLKVFSKAYSSSAKVQNFLIFVLLAVNALVIFMVHLIVQRNAGSFALWLSPVTGLIVWTVAVYLRNRVEIYRHGSIG